MELESQEDKELKAFAMSLSQEERNKVATDAVERMERDRKIAEQKVQDLIPEAQAMPITNNMHPCIYIAIESDGNYFVGINFQPKGKKVGDTFHFDHGAGIHKNEDAMIHWIKK